MEFFFFFRLHNLTVNCNLKTLLNEHPFFILYINMSKYGQNSLVVFKRIDLSFYSFTQNSIDHIVLSMYHYSKGKRLHGRFFLSNRFLNVIKCLYRYIVQHNSLFILVQIYVMSDELSCIHWRHFARSAAN